ncbi:LPS translocon maturation chaperone LptM [Halomonas halmophila]|uniref:Lipoprotein n=1 Tax=Halomonas halmophila TaxID=252 RepID=A0A4Y4F2G8_9GAMM|nr:hypothetical protein HHA01_26440 [Halomonas halmophila]
MARLLPLALLMMLALSACGQKGPLYMPEDQAAGEHQPDTASDATTPDETADEEGR